MVAHQEFGETTELSNESNRTSPPYAKPVKRRNSVTKGPEHRYECKDAIKVKVKVNVQEILNVDQRSERFTAMFTLDFFYIDPSLRNFETTVTYMTHKGMKETPRTVKGVIIDRWAYADSKQMKIRQRDQNGKESLLVLDPWQVLHTTQPDWKNGSYLNIKWTFFNGVGEAQMLFHDHCLEYCSDYGGHVFEKSKFVATFTERLELEDFPFDRQVLRMKFVAETWMNHIQFQTMGDDCSEHELQTNAVWAGEMRGDAPLRTGPQASQMETDSQSKGGKDCVPVEWRLCREEGEGSSKWLPAMLIVASPEALGSGARPKFEVVLHLDRNPSFYIWNVMVVLFIVTLATALAFNIHPTAVADRASVLVTVLLATIGTKHQVTQFMPVKPYLTFLDKYIVSSFLVQFAAICETFFVARFACNPIQDGDDDWRDGVHNGPSTGAAPSHECWPNLAEYDMYFAAGLYGSWVLWHLLFLTAPTGIFYLCKAITGLVLGASRHLEARYEICRFGVARRDWKEIYAENSVYPVDKRIPPGGQHPFGMKDHERHLQSMRPAAIGISPPAVIGMACSD